MTKCLGIRRIEQANGFLGICSTRGKKGKQRGLCHTSSPVPPVGSFDASEVGLHCDHSIAVHLQDAEDMFMYLIAKPRRQDIDIKVQGHQGMREVATLGTGEGTR